MAFGDKLQAIANRALSEGLAKLPGERGGNHAGERIGQIPAFWERSQKKRGGGEAAKGIKIVEAEGGGGGEG